MLCLVYNFIQYLRMYLDGLSFKDVLGAMSTYLLIAHPPKSLVKLETAFEKMYRNIEYTVRNGINYALT
jgi:hypothetical protein